MPSCNPSPRPYLLLNVKLELKSYQPPPQVSIDLMLAWGLQVTQPSSLLVITRMLTGVSYKTVHMAVVQTVSVAIDFLLHNTIKRMLVFDTSKHDGHPSNALHTDFFRSSRKKKRNFSCHFCDRVTVDKCTLTCLRDVPIYNSHIGHHGLLSPAWRNSCYLDRNFKEKQHCEWNFRPLVQLNDRKSTIT